MLRTVFSQRIDGRRTASCRFRKESAHFAATDDRFDGLILGTVADDNANATIQGPRGRTHL